jgi:DNA-binding SARP family transcriptional activator
MIELRTLGPVEIRVDGDEAPRELRWRKNLALLLYLARSPGGRRSREHLIGLLWGDKPDAAARHSLNEALRVIRKTVGEEALESIGDQVGLSGAGIALDVESFEQSISERRLDEAGALVRGSWMEGFVVPDSIPFEDWLSAERQHWNQRATTVLQELGAHALAGGDETAAREAARRALAVDPYSEGAVRLLIESAALRGERASALGLYEEFARRLDDDLGIEPEPATRELVERVRQERIWQLPAEASGEELWARRAPLVGRERELATLVSALRRSMATRSPAVIVCQGESGSGKTRLAEELIARARLEGAAVSHVRAVPADAGTDWSVLLGLAAGGLLEAEGAAVAPPGALATLLERTGWQDPVLREHAAGATPRMLPQAFTEVAQAVSELRPLLLWIDGAENLDAQTGRALPGIVRDLAAEPVTLLLSLQSHPPQPQLDEIRARIGRDVEGAVVTLAGLSEADIRTLAGEILPELAPADAERLARRIAADSAGLPLFAVDLLNGVRLGLELDELGTWPQPFQTMDQTYPGELPDAVTAAIRIGFRRLSDSAQQVLSMASALDEPVTRQLLARVTGLTDEPLSAALDELEWQRWLSADARGYAFVARIVREVVARDMLTRGQRLRIRELAAGAAPSA